MSDKASVKEFVKGAPPVRPIWFDEVQPNYGFDPFASPNPWLMLPAGAMRPVWLRNGAGLQVRTDREDLVEVMAATDGADSFLAIQSSKGLPGKGRVIVADGHPVLDFSVKKKITVEVAFFYINRGTTGTGRSPANLDDLIVQANSILESQANIVIQKGTVQPNLPIPNLPATVSHASDWSTITKTTDHTAYLNVYFVRDYIGSGDTVRRPGVIRDTEAETDGKHCLFEDDVDSAARTLAHEVVHRLLGNEGEATLGFREGHSLIGGELMFSGKNNSGRKIPKKQVDLLNPD